MVKTTADSSFILANAQIVDYPIVYCNESFCKTSGYNRAEVFLKNDDISKIFFANFCSDAKVFFIPNCTQFGIDFDTDFGSWIRHLG